jgi:hypothetical protein
MRRTKLFFTMLVASAITASNASGAEYGTVDEAKSMLSRAIAAVELDKTQAINKFNHNESPFRDRDLFVFCFNANDGKFTAHEAMVSIDVRTLRDKSGKMFGEEMYRTAKEGQIAEVGYLSPIPGSTDQVQKRAYVTRIADQVCGVSVYRFNGPALSVVTE